MTPNYPSMVTTVLFFEKISYKLLFFQVLLSSCLFILRKLNALSCAGKLNYKF